MIYVFWCLALPTGALASLLLLMSLLGHPLSAATPVWLTILAALMVWALLGWAYHVATVSLHPGWACGLVVTSWLLFGGVMLVNGLLRQTLWN